MANEIYRRGRKNLNGYKNNRNKLRIAATILTIVLVVALALVVDYSSNNNQLTWSDLYQNSGLIEKTPDISSDNLAVYYLDVGQSDCSILCNEDKVLMIDTGAPSEINTIREVLQSLGITKIDYLIITHQHDDHMGCAVDILNYYEVSNIIMPRLSSINMVTTKAYETLLTTIKEKNINAIAAEPGLTFNIGDAKCTVLAPLKQDENMNNMSVVTKITFGENSFLFQGDAEKKVESAILKSGADVSADIIKIGHHGSKTSTSVSYIEAVSPKIAIISCGKVNSYGHPHEVTLDTLTNKNIDTYITYQTGLISVKSDGKTITVMNSYGVVKTYE